MIKVLLVDDEQPFLNSAAQFIRSQMPDFEVCSCFLNGEDALDYFRDNHVDILVTDISMPRMDGLELARNVYLNYPHCRTIILSGYNDFEYARTAIKYRVMDYLSKPVDYRELKSCLESLSVPSQSTLMPLSSTRCGQFWWDLTSGKITSQTMLTTRFSTLEFPFRLNSSSGALLRATSRLASPNGEFLSQVHTALEHHIRDYYFFSFAQSHDEAYFAAVRKNSNSSKVSDFYNLCIPPYTCTVYRYFDSLKDFIPAESLSADISDKTLSPLIRKAVQYIHQNYAKDISRTSIAKEFFVSCSYFSTQFKKEMGVSFMEYLTNIRITVAIELLKSDYRINDISERVGYVNRARFIANFREITGCTPSEYRKQQLGMGADHE